MRTHPNAGHFALCDLAALPWIEDLTIVTRNVDDLHERAGSLQVVHLHGSLFAPRCLSCERPAELGWSKEAVTPAEDKTSALLEPPLCSYCRGRIRPGVVWFYEELPLTSWNQAVACATAADLLLLVGTSGRIYPAAGLPEITERQGRAVWVIDPDEGVKTGKRQVWPSTAAVTLPLLVAVCRDGE